MHFFSLERFADEVEKTSAASPFIVQIGAMDGVSFDQIHDRVEQRAWHGLMVEPLKDHFDALISNYDNARERLTFENVAIGLHDGECTMRRLDPTRANAYGAWARSIAGVADGLGHHRQHKIENIQDAMIEENVPCMRLSTLLEKHQVPAIDLLMVDTEGYDYKVLQQLDFSKYRPRIINIEAVHLSAEERQKAGQLLQEHHYAYVFSNKDLIAVPKELLREMDVSKEIAPYQHYLDDGLVKDKADLAYAVALLGQVASCLTGKIIGSSATAVSDAQNYYDDVSSVDKQLRGPNIREALDGIDRLLPLFQNNKEAMQAFIQNELPALTIRQTLMPEKVETYVS